MNVLNVQNIFKRRSPMLGKHGLFSLFHSSARAATKPKVTEKQVKGRGVDAKKNEDFPTWYQQVVTKAEIIDYYDISGCYILRPYGYAIWENIQAWMDKEFRIAGVKNAAFPLLVTEKALLTEQSHIDGFAPEVAWVTKAGSQELTNPVAIRPTSETIMYPAFARWIKSHRDLPLMINQWNSVVRWEMDRPMPFIRSREFLWQEGHSAFETKEEADREVLDRLETYKDAYEKLLAVPVIGGTKSENEKFAGAEYTSSLETFIKSTNRAVQAATSHHLGQNFSRMFDIKYQKDDQSWEYVYQNSWGFSTRAIGVMIMMHGDDKGLMLPPMIAPYQVVIVPIFNAASEELVVQKAIEIQRELQQAGIRVYFDNGKVNSPGEKYNEWEMKGVPLRIEIGPKDIQKQQVTVVRRDNGEKSSIPMNTSVSGVEAVLKTIQKSMFDKAKQELEDNVIITFRWEQFVEVINNGQIAQVPWCTTTECEQHVKKGTVHQTGEYKSAKSLCLPFHLIDQVLCCNCFACSRPAERWALFGRSF